MNLCQGGESNKAGLPIKRRKKHFVKVMLDSSVIGSAWETVNLELVKRPCFLLR